MKKIIAVLLSLTLFNSLQAQSPLEDSLVARYNRNDFNGFYALGSAGFKSKIKPEGISGWLKHEKSLTGRINRSFLSADSGSTRYFAWDCAKEMISFKLVTAADGGFEGFDFKVYHLPPAQVMAMHIPNDNPLKTRLDSAVNYTTVDFMATHHLVGLSIGVVSFGYKRIYNYGTTEKGKEHLPSSRTLFELASVTKTFTGILLAQAVLDKKIGLDDDIRKYMPGSFPNLQYQGHPLKVADLGNHTSGLPPELPNLDTFKNSFAVMKMYDHYTDAKFFADLRTVKIDTLPGVSYSYSNAGMKLLGIILEKVYGRSYQQLLEKYITRPLNMPATRTEPAVSDTTSYTKGYSADGMTMPHASWPMFGGAGGLLSDSHDMVNYIAANIAETLPAIKLAHQQTFANSDNGFALGMGWQITPNTVIGTRFWKSGGALGFRSYCAVIPDQKVGVVWLSNRSDLGEDEMGEMIDQLLLAAIKDRVLAAK